MLRSTACLTCVVRPAETGMMVRGDTINGLGKYRRSTISNASGTKNKELMRLKLISGVKWGKGLWIACGALGLV